MRTGYTYPLTPKNSSAARQRRIKVAVSRFARDEVVTILTLCGFLKDRKQEVANNRVSYDESGTKLSSPTEDETTYHVLLDNAGVPKLSARPAAAKSKQGYWRLCETE